MIARPRPSKEEVRLRLYILSVLIDLAMLGLAFALANILVLGSLMGEPGKPHGLIMAAMIAPVYALIAINGGAYGIRMIGNRRASAVKAVWSLAQAARSRTSASTVSENSAGTSSRVNSVAMSKPPSMTAPRPR